MSLASHSSTSATQQSQQSSTTPPATKPKKLSAKKPKLERPPSPKPYQVVLESLKDVIASGRTPEEVCGQLVATELQAMKPDVKNWMMSIISQLFYQIKEADRLGDDNVRQARRNVQKLLNDLAVDNLNADFDL